MAMCPTLSAYAPGKLLTNATHRGPARACGVVALAAAAALGSAPSTASEPEVLTPETARTIAASEDGTVFTPTDLPDLAVAPGARQPEEPFAVSAPTACSNISGGAPELDEDVFDNAQQVRCGEEGAVETTVFLAGRPAARDTLLDVLDDGGSFLQVVTDNADGVKSRRNFADDQGVSALVDLGDGVVGLAYRLSEVDTTVTFYARLAGKPVQVFVSCGGRSADAARVVLSVSLGDEDGPVRATLATDDSSSPWMAPIWSA